MSETTSSSHAMQSAGAPGLSDGPARLLTGSERAGGRQAAEDQLTVISTQPPLSAASPAGSGAPGQMAAGTRLGHFELLEFVGGGGMGRVFRAMDTALARVVALKVLPREQAADEETLARFRNEARTAARLNHEGIAQVYYAGEESGSPYIALEYVEGVNVRALVEQKGPLPLAEAVNYTLQVADALAHAAERNVVHRDIKPSNVLITPEGRTKLIDMGLARLRNVTQWAGDLTASGVTLGTFDYISPEQARDPRSADVRSDIYSLGCTLFYMLTGRPPFAGGTVLQKLLQHQGDEPPDVCLLRPDVPEEVSRLLRKMMAKDPRRRFADAGKLMQSLLDLARQMGLQPLGVRGQVWGVPSQRPVTWLRRVAPWAAPIAALMLIVFLLHLAWSGSSQPAAPPLPGPAPAAEESLGTLPDPRDFAAPGKAAAEPAAPDAATVPAPSALAPPTVGAAAAPGTPASPAAAPGAGSAEAGMPAAPGPAAMAPPTAAVAGGPAGSAQPPTAPAASPTGPAPLAAPQPGASAAGAAPAAGAAQPQPTTPASVPAASPRALLVVDPARQGPGCFASLGEACAAAAAGDRIELRFNGRQNEKPIALGGLQVTIAAGEGFVPVLVFRPSETDPVNYPRTMFQLGGTRLTLSNVAVELEIPQQMPAEGWSMFGTVGGESLWLEKCSLTIRNAADRQTAYHQEVTFFRLGQLPGSDALAPQAQTPARRVSITLADCIVRGEASLLRAESAGPAELAWKNGLLVTSEPALVGQGTPEETPPENGIHVTLDRVTAVARGGLCRMTLDEFSPHQPPVRFDCRANILVIGPSSPLVEQIGVATAEQALTRFEWSGERNYYEGLTDFWTIRPADPGAEPARMDFDAWKTYWKWNREKSAVLDGVPWRKLPGADRPLHAQTPADYALVDPAIDDSALGVTGEVGVEADRLPQLPPDPAPPPLDARQP